MKPFRLPRDNKPLFDLISHGRAGSGRRMYLSPAQVALIGRTVGRAPEVMVKVTGGAGSSTGRGVIAHFNYIDRGGDLEVETDDGERLVGKDVGRQLLRNWDLDMDEEGQQTDLFAFNRRKPMKGELSDLVNLVSALKQPTGCLVAHIVKAKIFDPEHVTGASERVTHALRFVGKDIFARLGLALNDCPGLRRVLESSVVSFLGCRMLRVADHARAPFDIIVSPFQPTDFALTLGRVDGEPEDTASFAAISTRSGTNQCTNGSNLRG